MENNASIIPVIGELEKLFSHFNVTLYGGDLPKPVIALIPNTSGKRQVYGWFTLYKAWKQGTEGYYEINICSDHLNRPAKDVVETLLHEMVHLYNMHNGIKDNSRGGTYHNKRFKEAAEAHGLVVEQSDQSGWSRTYLQSPVSDEVDRMLDDGNINIYRQASKEKKAGKGSSTRKYICVECGVIVRATKEVNVYCGDCNVPLTVEV